MITTRATERNANNDGADDSNNNRNNHQRGRQRSTRNGQDTDYDDNITRMTMATHKKATMTTTSTVHSATLPLTNAVSFRARRPLQRLKTQSVRFVQHVCPMASALTCVTPRAIRVVQVAAHARPIARFRTLLTLINPRLYADEAGTPVLPARVAPQASCVVVVAAPTLPITHAVMFRTRWPLTPAGRQGWTP